MTKNIIQISEVKLTYQSKVKSSDRIKVNDSQDAFNVFYDHWDLDTIEHIEEFKILLLNRANKILGLASLFKGGGSGTVIDQKVIFQYSLKANAHQIILAHNHPSGNLNPSSADQSITTKIKNGAELLNITLLDHLIISPDRCFYSFADEGLL
jgi:DNA repair protein RadC